MIWEHASLKVEYDIDDVLMQRVLVRLRAIRQDCVFINRDKMLKYQRNQWNLIHGGNKLNPKYK